MFWDGVGRGRREMALTDAMDHLANTVDSVRRKTEEITQELLAINTVVYDVAGGHDSDITILRELIDDLESEMSSLSELSEIAEDAHAKLTLEASRYSPSEEDALDGSVAPADRALTTEPA